MIPGVANDLLLIDVETSGTDPFQHDVLSIAVVPLRGELEPLQIHVKQCNTKWERFAKANFERFESQWREHAVAPQQACDTLDSYIRRLFNGRKATPAGHNIGFDLAFLRKLRFVAARPWLDTLSHRAVDTHSLLYALYAAGRIPQRALSSDGAFDYFSIAVESAARHTALGDALATRELLLRLFDMLGADVLHEMAPQARIR